MANCSNTYGTIKISVGATNEKEQKRLIKNFFILFDNVMSSKTACYFTDVEHWDYDTDEDGICGTGNFIGCGRWAFEANCRYTYDWLKQGVEKFPKLQEMWDELNKYNWKINYDFTDEEGGCEVLYEMNCDIDHRAGEDKAYQSVRYVEDYDYNPENLVKLNIFDSIDDAKECLGIE